MYIQNRASALKLGQEMSLGCSENVNHLFLSLPMEISKQEPVRHLQRMRGFEGSPPSVLETIFQRAFFFFSL